MTTNHRLCLGSTAVADMPNPDFLIIALPRSGTAWISALLTTAGSACIHEGSIFPPVEDGRVYGIADTTLFFDTDTINNHPARKLIIRRDYHDITRSLIRAGLPLIPWDIMRKIEMVEGPRIAFRDLFNADIMGPHFTRLTGQRFDRARHRHLCRQNIQNHELIEVVRRMAA